MKRCLDILLFLAAVNLKAQQVDFYKQYDHTNFRDCPLFKTGFTQASFNTEAANACLFFAINEVRAKRRLDLLEHETALDNAAWNHSRKMAEQNFFEHYNPKEKSRRAPSDRAKLAGITNPSIAECILHTPVYDKTYLELIDYMVKLWMNSPGHKAAIISKHGVSGGVGIYLQYMKKYDSVRAFATADFQWYKPVILSGNKTEDSLPYIIYRANSK